MAVIGQRITHAEEAVSARPALAAEAERLKIRPGATVLTIARTYRTENGPVETASIVMPVERYALVLPEPARAFIYLRTKVIGRFDNLMASDWRRLKGSQFSPRQVGIHGIWAPESS
jgi:hypothetical protein